MRLVRFIKILHTLGSIGMMGGLASCMVLVLSGPRASTDAFATVRHTIDALQTWLVVPSMLVCVFSGFLSMFVHKPYWNALWAWLKAISGLAVVLMTFHGQSLSRSVLGSEAAELPEDLRLEWSVFCGLTVIAALNVIVGVWRPRFGVVLR
jgi:hypothetical protein